MKKLIPLLVVSIFVLSGLGAVAVPEKEPLNKQDWALETEIKGVFKGYIVTLTNVGNELVTGNFSFNITTDAWIMFRGDKLSFIDYYFNRNPGEPAEFIMKPVIGFGPATINLEVEFIDEQNNTYNASAEVKGLVLLFYVLCAKTTVNISP